MILGIRAPKIAETSGSGGGVWVKPLCASPAAKRKAPKLNGKLIARKMKNGVGDEPDWRDCRRFLVSLVIFIYSHEVQGRNTLRRSRHHRTGLLGGLEWAMRVLTRDRCHQSIFNVLRRCQQKVFEYVILLAEPTRSVRHPSLAIYSTRFSLNPYIFRQTSPASGVAL